MAGLQCITVKLQKGGDETFLYEFFEVAAAKFTAQPTPTYLGLPTAFLQHNNLLILEYEFF